MAAKLWKYDVEVPAETAKGDLFSSLDFEPGGVVAIEVEIPGGHSGKTGIQIWYGDAQLLPATSDRWFVGNKTKQRVDLDDPFPGGIGWRAEVYNNGKRVHTFYISVAVDPTIDVSLFFPRVILLPSIDSVAPYDFAGAIGEAPSVYVPGAPTALP